MSQSFVNIHAAVVVNSDGRISASTKILGIEALEQGILYVTTIVRNTPADQAGLKIGDIITQVSEHTNVRKR